MAQVTCSVARCDRIHYARGWCKMHYSRWRRHGDPLIVLPEAHQENARGNPGQRLMAKTVMVEGGCWEFTGCKVKGGYGRLWCRGRQVMAHRAAYEEFVGPIPAGMHLDHICRNTSCVNPDHLEPVTQAENNRRMREAGA